MVEVEVEAEGCSVLELVTTSNLLLCRRKEVCGLGRSWSLAHTLDVAGILILGASTGADIFIFL